MFEFTATSDLVTTVTDFLPLIIIIMMVGMLVGAIAKMKLD